MDIIPLLSFLAGIASVLSPCVLPVVPLVIGYALPQRKTTEILSFVMGLFLIFTLTIVLTIIFTAAVNYYLHYFRIMAAVILVILGVLILVDKELFNFSFAHESSKKGVVGSFIWGLLTSIAWAPCYGSYLIALIAFSISTGNTIYSALNLILYTAGFSITIFAVGLLVSRLNLEKLAGQAGRIKKISGFLIVLAGFYLLWLALI